MLTALLQHVETLNSDFTSEYRQKPPINSHGVPINVVDVPESFLLSAPSSKS